MTPALRDIDEAVCARFRMTREALHGANRCRKVARPRQIAMYLARRLTPRSYPAIGQWFGRDHTTVLYAERRIAALMTTNPKVAAYVAELSTALVRQREAA